MMNTRAKGKRPSTVPELSAYDLVEMSGLKKQEIARRLGISPATVTRGIQLDLPQFKFMMENIIKSIRMDHCLNVAALAAEYAPDLKLEIPIFELMNRYAQTVEFKSLNHDDELDYEDKEMAAIFGALSDMCEDNER